MDQHLLGEFGLYVELDEYDNLDNYEIIVLKPVKPTKISLHIIYKNIAFENSEALLQFMEQFEDHDLVINGVIDLSIYKNKTLRLLYNTKYGKDNYLDFYKGINYTKKNDKDFFFDSMVTPQNEDYCLVPFEIKEKQKNKKSKNKKNNKYTEDDIKFENRVPCSVVEQYVNILSKERTFNRKNWYEIMICVKNCNINAYYIFDKWSKQTTKDNYDPDGNKDIWDEIKAGQQGLGTLRLRAKEDNPEKYKKLNHSYFSNDNDVDVDKENELMKDFKIKYEDDKYVRYKCKYEEDLIEKVANLLSKERLSDYVKWKYAITILKNYGFIEIAEKITRKYNTFSNREIIDIFQYPIGENFYKIERLFDIAAEDNFKETVMLIDKYDYRVELRLINSDEYLLYNFEDKVDFLEEERYISKKFLKKAKEIIDEGKIKVIILHCPTGTGKTYCSGSLLDYIKSKSENWDDVKILSVICRRTMVGTLSNAFCDENGKCIAEFKSYLKHDWNATYTPNKFIVSLEQLSRIDEDINTYDIIILDEITSLLIYIYSETMDNYRRTSFFNLLNYVEKAKLVIACDANMTSYVLNFFNKLRPDEVYYYRNTFKNKEGIPMEISLGLPVSEEKIFFHFARK